MKIQIQRRLKPFSHTPGSSCLIPGTCLEIEAFPALIRLGKKIDIPLQITGPVREFTLEQDLEQGCVRIFGRSQEGYYRLQITASDRGVTIYVDRAPTPGLNMQGKVIQAKHTFFVPLDLEYKPPSVRERLSLGGHKAQDWDRLFAKCALKEILPVLFFLGQSIPSASVPPLEGAARCLLLSTNQDQLEHSLETFIKVAFKNILVPCLVDEKHQGIVSSPSTQGNPCFLLQEGAKQIRALFFKQVERRIQLLPLLPLSFDAGRMIHVQMEGIGILAFEWSKKVIQRAILRVHTSGDIILQVPKGLNTLRVRTTLHEKGIRQAITEPLVLTKGKTYFLDRFQK